ncbi:MAG: paraquat-inducible protein A [Halieaceae bacterium]|jgi:paraquat-inducible protein A|nr:paraquat-inducible protein A [Halieaceae bacterium]
MKDVIACHACDLLVDIGEVMPGQKATCPRCGHYLTHPRPDAPQRLMAYSVAALVALALANAFPFLSFASAGIESVMSLPQTPRALWQNGLPLVSLLVAAFIIVIPAVMLVMLLALGLPLARQTWRPWLVPLGRWVFRLQNWAMVEVFIIGVIVSLVKIAKMATVSLGLSFWSYIAFAMLFTLAISVLDRHQIWTAIGSLEPRKND